MKFREIFRFEFTYQARRFWTWLFFFALLVFSFLMTRDNSLAEALYDDFFLNSPFAIAKTTIAGSLIWLLVVAALAGDVAARDVATGMYPLTYTAPVSKAEYLGGRFLAVFALNAWLLLAVQIGILLAVYLPGVDAEIIGPFRPAAYLTAYAFLALPNALVATALQFMLATQTGRPMAAYLGSVFLFFMSYIVGIFLFFQGRQDLANLLDPIGVHFILSELSHLWTPAEKRWRLIGLEGTVLTNRLLWLGTALAVITLTYLRFRFIHRAESSLWKRISRPFNKLKTTPEDTHSRMSADMGVTTGTPISRISSQHKSRPAFGFVLHARQTLAIALTSFRTIATSWAGIALLAGIPMLTIPVVIDQMEVNGVPLVPTTVQVIGELTAPLSAELSRWVIIPLLIIFFAGELVWRERDARLAEISDAVPGSEWLPFLGKYFGLGLVLGVYMALLMMAGVLAQTILGYHPDSFPGEIALYLKVLFGLQLPEYLLFALLALAVHVVVDQKYIGHFVAITAYVIIILAPMFGIEHNLLIYGAGPAWSYTEMRGFGPSLGPWLWFKLYWAAWALLLAVVAKLFWMRGREKGLRTRLRLARQRFTRATFSTAATGVVLMLALGGFIFYNTNVLNAYRTEAETETQRATYEQHYGKYNDVPQPQLVATTLNVEIYPEHSAVDIDGTYRLVNQSTAAIDSIHVATASDSETSDVKFDRAATHVLADQELGYHIYALAEPLLPGDSLQLRFRVHAEPEGFRENGVDAAVVANGTYFSNGLLPAIGYQKSRELISASDRRKYGLASRPLIASLYDAKPRNDRGAGVAFEAIIGTRENQVAVAPGALRRTWVAEGQGRRYFHYATDGTIGNEWAFFSARYKMKEVLWEGVTIRIFYHPGHDGNVDRMLESVRASLEYYTEQFGPYRYNHLNVVEHAGNGSGMHADPSMIIYTEGFSQWAPEDDPQSLDLPFAVTAHEMAHQWTVPYASVEGAPVMSESVAWYYGMKVVEKAKGPEHLQWLLRFMRQPHPYAPIRRGEPLLRGLDPYLSYRRGPFALYALSEYIGERQVNGALRRMLEKHRPEEAPLATTLDLYGELKAVTPDSLQYLLHDLFEVNTYWELGADRATAKQTPSGKWQLTLDVQANKVVADSAGVETKVAMNDWIEIGVFKNNGSKEPLYLQKHHIRSGKQTITVDVSEQPGYAGIDPNQLLIDLETNNNTRKVEHGKD